MSRQGELGFIVLLGILITGYTFLSLLTWFFTQLLTLILLSILTTLLLSILVGLPVSGLLLREKWRQYQAKTRLLMAEVKQKETVSITLKRDEILYTDQAHLTVYMPPQIITLKTGEAIFYDGDTMRGHYLPLMPAPVVAPATDKPENQLDPHWLSRVFNDDLCHALLIGARNSGKSTLFNRLLVNFAAYWPDAQITLLDPMFNKVDSGWLIPDGFQVMIHKVDGHGFVKYLHKFYQSHKARADLVEVSRSGGVRQMLAVDELPTLLKQLKADNSKSGKARYDEVMFMLRAIYSGGSHTEHNLILMSQTALVKDLDISESDKSNFVEVALQEQAANFLSRQKGVAGKAELYKLLSYLQTNYDYYAAIRGANGVELQAVPDLSAWGAKRNYGNPAMPTDEPLEENDDVLSEAKRIALEVVMDWPIK